MRHRKQSYKNVALLLPLLLVSIGASAGVVDRLAVTVGNTAITETEVLDEVRLTQFLNNEPLDLGPTQRRAAANRLVDQELIRNEMLVGQYAQPQAGDSDALLRSFVQTHYPDRAQFEAALLKYSLTEDQVKRRLVWQLQVLRFTDLRFGTGLPPASQETAAANREQDGETAEGARVDQEMDSWLKDARSQTRVSFKNEAYQ